MNPKSSSTDEVGDDPTIELTIEKIIGGGRGLAHHEGETLMVSGAMPGERIIARTTRRRAGITEAVCLEVVQSPHPARIADPCPRADICGGCDWPHVDPETGAHLKSSSAAESARVRPDLAGAIESAPIHTSLPASRIRARLHWDPTERRLGFYESQSHRVVDISPCRIISPALKGALATLERNLERRCHQPVDVEWLEGSDPERPIAALRPAKGGPKEMQTSWIPERPEMEDLVAGFHRLSRSGAVRAGWGLDHVIFDLPVSLTVPIGAFFQGNRFLLERLFSRVADLSGDAGEPVFDLHAGVGLLAAAASSRCTRDLFLSEPNFGAARAAQHNLPQARVAVGMTAEEAIQNTRRLPTDALVITDPPRSGMSSRLRRSLARWRPQRILTLGCDAATWSRDAFMLLDSGYGLETIELFDLFPHTHHVEILALLERA